MYVTIPVDSYLKKYLTKKYGDFLFLTKNTSLGIHLIELLSKELPETEPTPVKMDDYYVINISGISNSIQIQEYNYNVLNNISVFVDKIFREHLFDFVNIYKYQHGKELPGIRLFLDFYDISEDELSLDSIYRYYKRHKAKRNMAIISCSHSINL